MPLRSRLRSFFQSLKKKGDPPKSPKTNPRSQLSETTATINDLPSLVNATTNAGPVDRALSKAVHSSPFMSNPSNFVIRDPHMINVEQLTQIIQSGNTVLQLLDEKRTCGAEVDSSERDDPPRCHPDTRKEVRQKITVWRSNPERECDMLWLLGPAGVGKSAIAQTIAEECAADGSLGATFFFSRLNNRNNPNSVIPTIVYQLVVQHPEYKQLVTQLLAANPSLLEKNLRTQFRELIIKPFKVLMMRDPLMAQRPFMIILDGLDECNGRKAQCEFIHLISEHIRLTKSFPLIWMVCSRPEWHLKSVLADADFYVDCVREELSVDDSEAQQDVYRYLQDGFKEIRKTFLYILDDSWPLETDVQRIAKKASGLFIFASTLLKFVGDQDRCEPKKRLKICLKFIENSQAFEGVNPLHFLDLLYHQILLDVPSDILPTSMQILGLCLLYSDHKLSTRDLANFLGLDQGSFYTALQWFHSVMVIPASSAAGRDGVRFYHASFGDFLKNSSRSGKFALDQAKSHCEVAMHCLRWHASAIGDNCELEPGQCACPSQPMELKWVPDSLDFADGQDHIRSFAHMACWDACTRVQNPYIANILAELRLFPFCHLSRLASYPHTLESLIRWLRWIPQDPLILRNFAESDEDRLILEKYLGTRSSPCRDSTLIVIVPGGQMACRSLHLPTQEPLGSEYKHCTLIGSGDRACLVGFISTRGINLERSVLSERISILKDAYEMSEWGWIERE
ncbi:hypothetical protein P691DRAFT_728791 [Macrolepiota fuliginosa MF-IS2]|uniref:NACHT domain-containing protein n=1 Tax=Macrolepiota fuliginosa MF-IS2 TaxID=1400762 RepID=A0A9P5XDD0_9AGAR|nr:hypothetical protein P691DRAFT_728791 [Macrolepiota fuliginosa MF-IS2]